MLNLLDLQPGATLQLRENVTAEVTENMGDGQWVMVRYLTVPGRPDEVGTEELCHAQDIVRLLAPPGGG
jgi:hypothetical protein